MGAVPIPVPPVVPVLTALGHIALIPASLPIGLAAWAVLLASHLSERDRGIARRSVPTGRVAVRLFARTVPIAVRLRLALHPKTVKPFPPRRGLVPNVRFMVQIVPRVDHLFEKGREIARRSVPIGRVAVRPFARIVPIAVQLFLLLRPKRAKWFPSHRVPVPNVLPIVRIVQLGGHLSAKGQGIARLFAPTGRVAVHPFDPTAPAAVQAQGPTGRRVPGRMPFLFRLPA